MKNFKKIISIILVIVMCFGIFAVSGSAKQKEKLNYLLLGDSIAEGFGLENPDEACYGKIVANTNGYNYTNLARMATMSEDLDRRLDERADIIAAVKEADIISISVGGNDFLLNNAALLIVKALFLGSYSDFPGITEDYNKNLHSIIAKIKALNPDAVILLQALYNPWSGKTVHNIFQHCCDSINGCVRSIAEEYPDSVYVVETEEAFNFRSELISKDTVHPGAEGNEVLAKLVLEKLYEIGLGENTEPVINTPGITRDYLTEYFGPVIGAIIKFAANLATGNMF